MNRLEIYNSAGEMVFEQKRSDRQVIEVETENFNEGVYFYKITNEPSGQVFEGQMIVESPELFYKEKIAEPAPVLKSFFNRPIAKGIFNLFF